ncbi:histidyl tRS [Acrasis kona]|uniref:histidine--tRNA ligase n=1 Tax=Acrasis kona TaxID=1008807 RepID=A0AAW2Z5D1_9EUKA
MTDAPPQNTKAKPESQKKPSKKGRGGMIVLEPVAGTRDFIPSDMRYRAWLFSKFHAVAKKYGFEEYDAPILESEELYKRKAGEEITQQMYNFTDKSEQQVALRPEMTPSLARLILSQGKSLLMPVKWYSIPQCWRYETTTRGRKREHYQWNMDIWGVPNVSAEAELLAAICEFFKLVGLTSQEVGIKISSRKVLETVMKGLNISSEQFAPACVIVDKLDKLQKEDVVQQLSILGISEESSLELISIMQIKDIDELSQKIGEESVAELRQLFDLVKGYGVAEYLRFDASIVRGLSYYTGVVFEAFSISRNSELSRAICGGGRYDRILTTYGAKQDTPACGFGFGDVVILEILRDLNKIPKEVSRHVVNDLVVPFNEDLRPQACKVVTMLRDAGIPAEVYLPKTKKIANTFSYAERIDADRVIMIAPDEWNAGEVKVKYMKLQPKGVGEEEKNTVGVQFAVKVDDLLNFVIPEEEMKQYERR